MEEKVSTSIDNARSIVEREGIKTTKMSGTYVIDDGSNEASIPGFPYRFKAQGDKILVAVDIFKSGYECKTCKGDGKISSHCPCEDSRRPGFKYAMDDPKTVYTEAQSMAKCPECKGNYEQARKSIECPDCQGKCALLYLADESKSLPTTGVVVSKGAEVKWEDIKLNSRVLFGAYSGTMIPTRAPGVVFKVLREHEILLTISGGEDMAAFDFVTIDKEM